MFFKKLNLLANFPVKSLYMLVPIVIEKLEFQKLNYGFKKYQKKCSIISWWTSEWVNSYISPIRNPKFHISCFGKFWAISYILCNSICSKKMLWIFCIFFNPNHTSGWHKMPILHFFMRKNHPTSHCIVFFFNAKLTPPQTLEHYAQWPTLLFGLFKKSKNCL